MGLLLCPSKPLLKNVFLVLHAYEKEKRTSHFIDSALLLVCLTCVIDDVDVVNALGYCCVMCEWFPP